MKTYIFKSIKFDWQWIYVMIGVVIVFLSWRACIKRSAWCNIFEKEGAPIEYKVLAKKESSTNQVVFKNLKTGEWTVKNYYSVEQLMFETLKVGDTIKKRSTLEESLTTAEKEKLWPESEPIGRTWFLLFSMD